MIIVEPSGEIGGVGEANEHMSNPATATWGPEQQEALSTYAAHFKSKGDLAGVYLCAIVEELVKQESAEYKRSGERPCPVTRMFYLSLVVVRSAEAEHSLYHMLFPQIQELLRLAYHRAEVRKRKKEAGIDQEEE